MAPGFPVSKIVWVNEIITFRRVRGWHVPHLLRVAGSAEVLSGDLQDGTRGELRVGSDGRFGGDKRNRGQQQKIFCFPVNRSVGAMGDAVHGERFRRICFVIFHGG